MNKPKICEHEFDAPDLPCAYCGKSAEQLGITSEPESYAAAEAKGGSHERLVSCYSCGKPNAKHEIREMSTRCGKHLCDDCNANETWADRQMRNLCS